jgi:acetolactate synthase-1/2/3 large subunit
MAEAYGKLTGRPGVCMVTRGPGACNAAIGVHTAFQDSTAMILLIGQVPRPFTGRESFQEVDYRQMFGPLAKWADQVESASDMPELMAQAFLAARQGRPGPAVLALPQDVLKEQGKAGNFPTYPVAETEPDPAAMEQLRGLLAGARRPMMLVGGGGWTGKGRADIIAFAEKNNLPVCCSFRRNDIFENAHPCFAGHMGIGPDPDLLQRVKDADLLLVVGARLGEMTSQGYTLIDEPEPKQTLIHVHSDPAELGRVFKPALAIHARPDAFAAAADRLEPVQAAWADWTRDAHRAYQADNTPSSYGGALDLGQAMLDLRKRLAEDAVVTVDAGNYSGWPQRFLTFGPGRRLLGPTSGAMGYSVPAAIAAKIAEPKRQAIATVGDGSFGMTGQELATAVKYGLDPIILVFNNAMYGTIRAHQEKAHPFRVIGTDLGNPDFAALARAYGAHGETVEKTEDFLPAFDRAVASGKAAVLDLRMDPNLVSTRFTIETLRQAAERQAGKEA